MEKLQKRIVTGTVVSDAMDKTVVVRVERSYRDPKLHKIIRSFKKYKVHDEQEVAQVGDVVEFYQTRPLSKTKYMTLHKIVTSSSANS
jgi:small subunit ribosomal protein S17